ncbi:MAG: hypothetical protein FJZ47_24920 [Candidatus Tectomicrobia bacterium]|uniref:Transposase (putative) YhgA-like domain-containing protein n=1 Tax=Tectimicrobiota bacterium TaxID=2528274 RepID=A0A938B396_UNCTE|nr:hypothetical protein [Candidatus Tectomicrobia bacterium]
MQVLLLAAAHPERHWEVLAGRLLAQLDTRPHSGGIDYLYVFLHTQEPETLKTVRDLWQQHAPEVGKHLMTYAQELLQEGEAKGEMKAKVHIIENMLHTGMAWTAIEEITGMNEAQFQELKQRLATLDA